MTPQQRARLVAAIQATTKGLRPEEWQPEPDPAHLSDDELADLVAEMVVSGPTMAWQLFRHERNRRANSTRSEERSYRQRRARELRADGLSSHAIALALEKEVGVLVTDRTIQRYLEEPKLSE